jgi:hypothetical protein
MDTEDLARAFIARTLPKPQWTHEAHLRVGLWHVLHEAPDQALALLRERIRAYNEATGVANTEDGGYHETVTRLYFHLIRHVVESSPGGLTPDELSRAVIERIGAKDVPLRYYTAQRIFSRDARREWVEPDVQALPQVASP